MTDLEHDPVRAFAMALPYRLRNALRLDYETWPVIRDAATAVGGPQRLAKITAAGITRRHTNPWPIIWRRLQIAAGRIDTDGTPIERPTEEATT